MPVVEPKIITVNACVTVHSIPPELSVIIDREVITLLTLLTIKDETEVVPPNINEIIITVQDDLLVRVIFGEFVWEPIGGFYIGNSSYYNGHVCINLI